MKKKILVMLVFLTTLMGCFSQGGETLKIVLAPTKSDEELLNFASELEPILEAKLTQLGHPVDIEFSVAQDYELAGQSLESGTNDLGFIPAGTFVRYESGLDGLLTALHPGVENTSTNPQDWNTGQASVLSAEPVSKYQSLIIAGDTEIGSKLGSIINSGNTPTWEELSQATWCLGSVSSSSGYIYPDKWLRDNYNHPLSELPNQISVTGHGEAVTKLDAGVCDIIASYSDVRYDYQDKYSGDIWTRTNVIGVTDFIAYDTISMSKKSKYNNDDFKADLITVFTSLTEDPTSKEIIGKLNHLDYQKLDPAEYTNERSLINSD